MAFEDGALSFMLSKDATFGDLADLLERLGKRHHGKPVAIEVKLAAAFRRATRPTRPGTWSRHRHTKGRSIQI